PLGERHRLRPLAPRHARVVDEDVDLLEPFDRRVDDGLDLFDIRHIAAHGVNGEAAPPQALNARDEPFLPTRAEHHRRARFGKTFRELRAESTRSARHNRHAATKVKEFFNHRCIRTLQYRSYARRRVACGWRCRTSPTRRASGSVSRSR